MERLLAFFLRQRDKAIGNSTQLEVFMSHLKSLTAVAVPRGAEVDPRLARRQRLIERLEEQRRLKGESTISYSSSSMASAPSQRSRATQPPTGDRRHTVG